MAQYPSHSLTCERGRREVGVLGRFEENAQSMREDPNAAVVAIGAEASGPRADRVFVNLVHKLHHVCLLLTLVFGLVLAIFRLCLRKDGTDGCFALGAVLQNLFVVRDAFLKLGAVSGRNLYGVKYIDPVSAGATLERQRAQGYWVNIVNTIQNIGRETQVKV